MARVTVEDCVDKISNRFELVMMASQRARAISAGAQLTVERDNDKNPVVSLREIAEDTVNKEELEEELIKSLQTFVATDEPEEEDIDLLDLHRDVDEQNVDVSTSSLSSDSVLTDRIGETDREQSDSIGTVFEINDED